MLCVSCRKPLQHARRKIHFDNERGLLKVRAMTPETEAALVTHINFLVSLVQRMDENIKAQGERIARMED